MQLSRPSIDQARAQAPAIIALLLGFLALMTPLAINGAPFYWMDTVAYVKGGSVALEKLTGIDTPYAGGSAMSQTAPPAHSGDAPPAGNPSSDETVSAPTSTAPASTAGPSSDPNPEISSARSPYYALLLAVAAALGGLTWAIAAKALMVLLAGFMVLRHIFGADRIAPAGAMIAVAVFTPASIYCAVLLPDIFAPIGIVAAASLLAFGHRLSFVDKTIWSVLLTAALVTHTSHLANAVLMLIGGGVLAFLMRIRLDATSVALAIAPIGVAIASMMAFSFMVERMYGYKPQSFPMLAASVFTDGPGREYLEKSCPQNNSVYCAYLDRSPKTVDEFLWSEDPKIGVYMIAGADERRLMSEQQSTLFLAALRHDFLGQFSASFSRFLSQLVNWSFAQFSYSDGFTATLEKTLDGPDKAAFQNSLLRNDRLNVALLDAFYRAVIIAGAGLLVFHLVTMWRDIAQRKITYVAREGDVAWRVFLFFAALIAAGVVINAGITGAASQPQGRYEARVIWLIPLIAVLLHFWKDRAYQIAAEES